MTRRIIGRAIIGGVVALIVLVSVALWFAWDGLAVERWITKMSPDLMACGVEMVLFSEWPADKDKVSAITPLGSMEPESGMVFPRDRLLWHTGGKGGANNGDQSMPVQIVAPGNGWITKVEEIEWWSGNKMTERDFVLYFSPCREVEAKFSHIQMLATNIDEQTKGMWSEQVSDQAGAVTVRSREAKVKIAVRAGEGMGRVGGTERSQAFDWGMTDERGKTFNLASATPKEYQADYTVCPLDYYGGGVRRELEKLLGDGQKTREIMPVCGWIDKNIVGTLQGRWRAEKTAPGVGEDRHVALVHDEIEPQKPVISMGTSLRKSGLKAGLYYFQTMETGYVNRDFGTVTEQGQVYCYQGIRDDRGQIVQRIVLIELVDDKSLRMEARPGFSCAANNYNFSDRMTAFER